MRSFRLLAVVVALLTATLHSVAYAETPEEIQKRILAETKFNLAMAEALPVPISQYKGDGDPTTLEMVIFSNKADGPSRVSDDGEVIFFYKKDSEKLQQQLIKKAFEIRIARAARET